MAVKSIGESFPGELLGAAEAATRKLNVVNLALGIEIENLRSWLLAENSVHLDQIEHLDTVRELFDDVIDPLRKVVERVMEAEEAAAKVEAPHG